MAINLNGTTGITTTGLTSNGIDDNATSTAMTLDTSGNLLVGKTSTGYTSGTEINNNGFIRVNRTDNSSLYVGRNNSDGELVSFRKDGNDVGSIGTNNSKPYFSNNTNCGIRLANNALVATNENGANEDNATDLGATDVRFKDLYLSGGVYLGGTGSANYLDDFEQGTWTPELAGSTTAGTQTYFGSYTYGHYRKVGDLVFVSGAISLTAFDAATAGDLHITNLPFTPVMGSNVSTTGLLTYSRLVPSTSDAAFVLATNALSYLRLRVSNPTGAGVAITTSDSPDNNTGLGFSVFYYV